MGESHLPQRIGAMTPVVEDESILGTNDIEEIGPEPDGDPDDTHQAAGRYAVFDVFGLRRHGPEEPKIVGGRHEHETVATHLGPLDRRMLMLVREAGAENVLVTRGRAELLLELSYEAQVNVLLIHHQS